MARILISETEAARDLCVPVRTVRRWVRRGILPSVNVEGATMLPSDVADRLCRFGPGCGFSR